MPIVNSPAAIQSFKTWADNEHGIHTPDRNLSDYPAEELTAVLLYLLVNGGQVSAGAGGSAPLASVLGLTNKAGTQVDPATEQNLKALLSAIALLAGKREDAASADGGLHAQLKAIVENTKKLPDESAIAPPLLEVHDFRPVMTKSSAAFTLPAVGSTVSVPVVSAGGFATGDLVQIAQLKSNVQTERVAVGRISSVGASAIALQIEDISDVFFAAAQGDSFEVGSELTGQTRLPPLPKEATTAEVYVVPSTNLAWASQNTDSAYAELQLMAQYLLAESPQASFTYRTATGVEKDIDGLRTLGAPLGIGASLRLSLEEVKSIRFFTPMPYLFRPHFKAVYS